MLGEALANTNCTVGGIADAAVAAAEQSGTNVTAGYTGNLATSATPIATPYYMAGLCPVNVHWHLGTEHLSVGQARDPPPPRISPDLPRPPPHKAHRPPQYHRHPLTDMPPRCSVLAVRLARLGPVLWLARPSPLCFRSPGLPVPPLRLAPEQVHHPVQLEALRGHGGGPDLRGPLAALSPGRLRHPLAVPGNCQSPHISAQSPHFSAHSPHSPLP